MNTKYIIYIYVLWIRFNVRFMYYGLANSFKTSSFFQRIIYHLSLIGRAHILIVHNMAAQILPITTIVFNIRFYQRFVWPTDISLFYLTRNIGNNYYCMNSLIENCLHGSRENINTKNIFNFQLVQFRIYVWIMSFV